MNRVVVMERFTVAHESDEMLLRVSGGGIAEARYNDLYGVLVGIDGVDEVTITRWHVGIQKYAVVEWSTIAPAIKKVLEKFFGKSVRIIERTRRGMPEDIGWLLGETNLTSMRDAMEDCALTEDEYDALDF